MYGMKKETYYHFIKECRENNLEVFQSVLDKYGIKELVMTKGDVIRCFGKMFYINHIWWHKVRKQNLVDMYEWVEFDEAWVRTEEQLENELLSFWAKNQEQIKIQQAPKRFMIEFHDLSG